MSTTVEAPPVVLDLVVEEMNLGVMKTNAEALRDLVKGKLDGYSVENYSGDRIKDAKVDKAELNNFAKKLNNKRLELERAWMKPFDPFKAIVDETVGLIKTASSKIDQVVKDVEQGEKDEKRRLIDQFWTEQKCELFRLEQIFDPRWLNKTTKLLAIQDEIRERIKKVEGDLVILDKIGEAEARNHYLDTLDLNRAMAEAERIKGNRERLAKAEALAKAIVAPRPPAETIPVKPETIPVKPETTEDEEAPLFAEIEPEPELPEASFHGEVPIVEHALVVRGPEKALADLYVYMSVRGIEYRRT
jgi:hypothetical protein